MSGATAASVVSTASIVAMLGASIAAPLAIPPMRQPSPSTVTVFGTVSVVMIARAAAGPPSAARGRRRRAGMPRAQRRGIERDADEPGRAHEDMLGRRCTDGGGSERGHLLGDLDVGAGGAVGVAAVEHDGARLTAGRLEMALGDAHRTGAGEVLGEHAGRGDRLAVVGGDDGEVGGAGRLDADVAAGGDEPLRGGDRHQGYTPTAVRPAVSSSPRARLAHWIACPRRP